MWLHGDTRSWMKRPALYWRWPCSFENLERQRGEICSANGFFWITTGFERFMQPCSIHRRRCLFQIGPRLTATGLCQPVSLLFRHDDVVGDVGAAPSSPYGPPSFSNCRAASSESSII